MVSALMAPRVKAAALLDWATSGVLWLIMDKTCAMMIRPDVMFYASWGMLQWEHTIDGWDWWDSYLFFICGQDSHTWNKFVRCRRTVFFVWIRELNLFELILWSSFTLTLLGRQSVCFYRVLNFSLAPFLLESQNVNSVMCHGNVLRVCSYVCQSLQLASACHTGKQKIKLEFHW